VAALDAMAARLPGTSIALVGWSFGGDIALRVVDARISGWIAIAPPLRSGETFPAGLDARPKHLILAEHDEYRAPADVQHDTASWAATTFAVVPGASHFFVGRTDAVLDETRTNLARLTSV
jgi:alpha/beta superfamily hydrolase